VPLTYVSNYADKMPRETANLAGKQESGK
jgi:hypothetical protein